MKKYLIILIILLAIIGWGVLYAARAHIRPVADVYVAPAISVPKDCKVSDESLISVVNKERKAVGAEPLTIDKTLDKMADYRSLEQDGAQDNHAGLRPYLAKYYSTHPDIGEVINTIPDCYGAKTKIDWFKTSSDHWVALMNPKYNIAGVGNYKDVLTIELSDSR